MNLSGEAVEKFYDYFEIDIEDILVIYDDLDTKTANFKLKAKGSSGGHNGLKSIISHLGTEKFMVGPVSIPLTFHCLRGVFRG